MSHPPETSFSSRELAVEIANQLGGAEMLQGPYLDIVPIMEKLIDAWVRVRELEARLDQMRAPNCSNKKCPYCEHGQDSRTVILQDLKSAIEQLKGAANGQAEAPSAAASANSEPGGA